MSKLYRICAVDAVIIKEKKVLLTKRSFGMFKNNWVLPGGKVRQGEDAASSCIREAKEETGLDIKIIEFVGFYDSPERDPEKHAISLAFLCRPVGGKLRHCSEASDIKFFSLDRLPENMGFDHEEIISDATMMLRK